MGLARAGEQRPRARRHRAPREVRPHVEPEDPVDAIALEHARGAHGRGAARRLLGGLEHEQDAATQLRPARGPRRKQLVDLHGGSKRHGHMGVVAARVHAPRMTRGERAARRLGDGQRVHVRPDGCRGRGAAIEERAHAARRGAGELAGKARQHALDIGHGPEQVDVELGYAVQVAAEPPQPPEPALPPPAVQLRALDPMPHMPLPGLMRRCRLAPRPSAGQRAYPPGAARLPRRNARRPSRCGQLYRRGAQAFRARSLSPQRFPSCCAPAARLANRSILIK